MQFIRSVEDWMKSALETRDPLEAERFLGRALRQARDSWDWDVILKAVVRGAGESGFLTNERIASVTRQALEEGTCERYSVAYEVAACRIAMGDKDGARAALAEAERWQAAHPEDNDVRWEWLADLYQALGDGYGDGEALRRCQAQSEALEAVRLLRPRPTLETSTDVRELLSFCGTAWAKATNAPEATRAEVTQRALDRAEQHATTVSEWLAIAAKALDAKDRERARRDAERAAELASTDDDRRDVAFMLFYRFGDEAVATKVGPWERRPEALHPVRRELAGWPSSASGLFDWVRARVSTAELTLLAESDYGHYTKEYFQLLDRIRQSGLLPPDLEAMPGEVIRLERWSSGADVDHLTRAFCCVLLCLLPQTTAGVDDELTGVAPQLVESALALGAEAAALAERLFAWRFQVDPLIDLDRLEPPIEVDERGVAALSLFLLRAAREPTDARLATLMELSDGGRPLLSARNLLQPLAQSQQAGLWEALITRHLAPSRSHATIARLLEELGCDG